MESDGPARRSDQGTCLMPKKPRLPFRLNGSIILLTDSDWLTVFGALLNDTQQESRQLAQRLLARSKQGRQIRLARLIRDAKPTLREMERRLKVSRRTVFRYLNGLEEQGMRLELNHRHGYELEAVPRRFKRVL